MDGLQCRDQPRIGRSLKPAGRSGALLKTRFHREHQEDVEEPVEDGLLAGRGCRNLARNQRDHIVQGISDSGEQGKNRRECVEQLLPDVAAGEPVRPAQEHSRPQCV